MDDEKKTPIAPAPDAKFSLPPGFRHPSFHYKPRVRDDALSEQISQTRAAGVIVALMGLFGFISWPSTDVQRNSYASKEDCEHDYATGQCTYDGSTGHSGSGYHHYGPWYRSDWAVRRTQGDPGPGRTFASAKPGSGFTGHGPTGFDFGSRGGFGAHGRVSARGG